MQEKDCATVSRGPEELPEETPLDGEDDILAEILAEEQKQKEEMEAEKKKAEAEAEKNMTPQEKKAKMMADQLEACDNNDLLCEARNDKKMREIEKKIALEEKLAK